MQSITINDTQNFGVTANPVDSAGAPGKLTPGAVATWKTDDATIAKVAVNPPDPTGLTATVTAVGPGTTNITASDQSSSANFFTPFQVQVQGGDAVGFTFTFGSPS